MWTLTCKAFNLENFLCQQVILAFKLKKKKIEWVYLNQVYICGTLEFYYLFKKRIL